MEPLSLQALCRAAIRNTLRSNAKKEHPEIDNMNRTRPKKKSNQKWSPLTRVTALPISVSDFVGRHEAELNSTFGMFISFLCIFSDLTVPFMFESS